MRDGFIYNKSFEKIVNSIPDEELQLLLYRAIVDYGITENYDKSDPRVVELMQDIVFQIDENEGKHVNSKYDYGKIRRLFLEGRSKKEIAEIMGCSVRTVERATRGYRPRI